MSNVIPTWEFISKLADTLADTPVAPNVTEAEDMLPGSVMVPVYCRVTSPVGFAPNPESKAVETLPAAERSPVSQLPDAESEVALPKMSVHGIIPVLAEASPAPPLVLVPWVHRL